MTDGLQRTPYVALANLITLTHSSLCTIRVKSDVRGEVDTDSGSSVLDL